MTGKASDGTLFDIGLVLEKAELWVRRCSTKLCDQQCVTGTCLSECRRRVTSQCCWTMERSKISRESQLSVCLHCLHMASLRALVNPTITAKKKFRLLKIGVKNHPRLQNWNFETTYSELNCLNGVISVILPAEWAFFFQTSNKWLLFVDSLNNGTGVGYGWEKNNSMDERNCYCNWGASTILVCIDLFHWFLFFLTSAYSGVLTCL